MKTSNNVSFLMVHYGNIFAQSELDVRFSDAAAVAGVSDGSDQFFTTYLR